MQEIEPVTKKYSIKELRKTEWDPEFEQLMRNRQIVGAIRYEPKVKGKKADYEHIPSSIERLKKYQETGNQEYLVDVANLCMIEFMMPSIDKEVFFEAMDDGEHCKKI